MREYAVTLVVTSALVSLALAITYREEERSSGAVRSALAVLLLYVTLCPLFGAVRNFDIEDDIFEVEEYDFEDRFSLSGVTEEAFCKGIRLFLADKMSLSAEEITVSAEGFDATAMRARKIKVTLFGKAALADYRAVRETVEKNGFGECEVKSEVK